MKKEEAKIPKKVIWAPQEGPQLFAVSCPCDEIFFGGSRGGGKLLSNDSLIQTPKGWRTHGDIAPGDTITDPTTGGSQKVLSVFPQGKVDLYRVTFDDGASVLAGLEHLWAYRLPNHIRPRTKKSSQRIFCQDVLGAEYASSRFSKYRVGKTSELIDALDRKFSPRIPLTMPVLFSVNGRIGDIDPYLLGLILGDGTFNGSGITITNEDVEIIEYLQNQGFRASGKKKSKNGVVLGWYLPTDKAKRIKQWAERHKLWGKTGADKFIPQYIFTTNIEFRISVLQGLLDSDGYVDDRGHIEFTNISDHLVYGVQELVRSIGGKATVSEPITGKYRDISGDIIECQDYRRVYIYSQYASNLVRLPRKKNRCVDRWNGGYENARKVVSIEYEKTDEATCIFVSSPHGLYITDDYIVTHNTDCAIGRQIDGALLHGHAWNGLFVRKNFKHFAELRRRIDELIREGLPATRIGGDTQTNLIKFKNGAVITMTAVEREELLDFFQGQQFCVAIGTKILMADGSPKKIEDIVAGDMVQTLEGARRVTRTFPPRVKECVKCENTRGTQFHPVDHRILSTSGWQSYMASQGSLALGTIVVPQKQLYNAHKHTQVGLSTYEHPYSGIQREVLIENSFETCVLTPCGEMLTYDITVDEVNHYITYDTGIVNINCEISIEEAPQFSFLNIMIDKLKGCMRSPHGIPCQMFLTGNPGGPGHHQAKSRYIDPAPPGTVILDEESGETRVFIPSNVFDNKILCESDPKYVNRLKSIKDPMLRRAWLLGDWDVVMGGFFDDVWSRIKHVLPVFKPPRHWPRIMGFDWGSARPFSVGWYAISDGNIVEVLGKSLPRGSIVRYAEWYGCEKDAPNTGLRMNSSDVALGILEREKNRNESMLKFDRIADPAIFISQDGPPISEKMMLKGVNFRPGDNKRIAGWDECRTRLAGKDGVPRFYVTENCVDFIRTVPSLERDDRDWEDINCFVAGTKVSTPYGDIPIEEVSPGDIVNTPIGPRRVAKTGTSISNATTIISLNNGKTIEGTITHKVMTNSNGLLPLCMLSSGDVLTSEEDVEWLKQLCSEESTLQTGIPDDTWNVIRKMLLSLERRFFIVPFGRKLMARLRKDSSSTILTGTQRITYLKILNLFLRRNMLDTITKKELIPVTISKKLLRIGEKATKDSKFLEKILKSATKTLKRENLRALIVATLLRQNRLQQNSVHQNVRKWAGARRLFARFAEKFSSKKHTTQNRSKLVVTNVVGSCAEGTRVYNLVVEQAHLFFANGVMASNTDNEDHIGDEWRYVVMSRQGKGPVIDHSIREIDTSLLPGGISDAEKDWDTILGIGGDNAINMEG